MSYFFVVAMVRLCVCVSARAGGRAGVRACRCAGGRACWRAGMQVCGACGRAYVRACVRALFAFDPLLP